MEIRFRASLPPIQGAIAIHGDGGVRIRLDVPDSDLPAAMKLVLLKGQVLNVAVNGDGEPVEIPTVPKLEGERYSPSQKLRQAVWAEWSVEQEGTFDGFYRSRMDGIIERVESGEI